MPAISKESVQCSVQSKGAHRCCIDSRTLPDGFRQSPAKRFFGPSGSSPAPSPLSPSFIDVLKNSLREGKRRAVQCSQSDIIEVEIRACATDSGESIPSNSSASCSYKPGQSVIVKDLPSVAEAATGWRRLPPRLPIPKWDVDD